MCAVRPAGAHGTVYTSQPAPPPVNFLPTEAENAAARR